MAKKSKKTSKDPLLKELVSIKKLLILLLCAADVPDSEINKAVKMGDANIRAMFSKKKLRKAKLGKGE